MNRVAKILRIGGLIVGIAFAVLVLLALYAPYEAGPLLHALNINVSGQWLAVWAAFSLGVLIVMAAFIGSLKGSGITGRRRR